MRLFTAILFDEEIKTLLYDKVIELQGLAMGTFTARDNLHLTVNFIGETNRVDEIKQAMDHAVEAAKAEKFQLSIRGLGKFKRNEGDIYWIGVEKQNTLWRLQQELVQELKKAGIQDIEDREYRPHLTLGRRVVVDPGFQLKQFEENIMPMQMEVKRISLMKSERNNGKMVYTEIYSSKL